jgi:hypothetical protein
VRPLRALPCAVPCSKSRCRLCRFSVPLFLTVPCRDYRVQVKIGSVHFGLFAVFSLFVRCFVVFAESERVKDKSWCGGGAHARRRRAPRAPQAPAPQACLCLFKRCGLRRAWRCGALLRAPSGSAAGAVVRCRGRCGVRSLLLLGAAVGAAGRSCGCRRALLRAPPCAAAGAAVPCRRRRCRWVSSLPPPGSGAAAAVRRRRLFICAPGGYPGRVLSRRFLCRFCLCRFCLFCLFCRRGLLRQQVPRKGNLVETPTEPVKNRSALSS